VTLERQLTNGKVRDLLAATKKSKTKKIKKYKTQKKQKKTKNKNPLQNCTRECIRT
tara:strand:- start:808 stop:975 length:168 start_codon:yes stop_codon:yes gene_type:complete